MRIAIIGAGIVGVTSAYMLAKNGHEVLVFDREPGPAMESSFANGGQLSYGFASPMGAPAMFRKLPSLLLGTDPAFKLPTTLSADFAKWSLKFLNQCRSKQAAKNGMQLAALATKSGIAFDALRSEVNVDFGHRIAGKLVLVQTQAELDTLAHQKNDERSTAPKQFMDWSSCIALEPALEAYQGKVAGGIWVAGDAIGDAAKFSEGLAKVSETELGVVFRFNADVSDILYGPAGVEAIQLSGADRVDCDAVVVCTGVAGTKILSRLGIHLPIYPVMGYSLTAPLGASVPEIAVTDAAHKTVFSRIGDAVRVAGYADFGMATEERRRQRVQELILTARRLMPELADYARISSTWIGARPATPNSLPIIGSSKLSGLYLNMGHGMFGWTLSAGAAQSIADLIGPAQPVSQ